MEQEIDLPDREKNYDPALRFKSFIKNYQLQYGVTTNSYSIDWI